MKSARIKSSFREALRSASAVMELVDPKYSPQRITFYVGMFGDISDIFWEIEPEDRVSIKDLTGKLLTDHEYWSIVGTALRRGVYPEASAQDSVLGVRAIKDLLPGAGPSLPSLTIDGREVTVDWLREQYGLVAVGKTPKDKAAFMDDLDQTGAAGTERIAQSMVS